MILYSLIRGPVEMDVNPYARGLKEIQGDLFDTKYKNIVIPTNGVIRDNGHGVLGAGVAKQFRDRVPGAEKDLGRHLVKHGNHFGWICDHDGKSYWAFPTKYDWKDAASRSLLVQSVTEMGRIVKEYDNGWVMPRVGTGHGGVPWNEVWVDLAMQPELEGPKIFVVALPGARKPTGLHSAESRNTRPGRTGLPYVPTPSNLF